MTSWELRTARSAYVVVETDLGLELAHWGRPVHVVPPRTSFETPAGAALRRAAPAPRRGESRVRTG